jgi:hypothetical protein
MRLREQMALLAPPELIGIHTNMPATVPVDIEKALQFHDPQPANLSADENVHGISSTFSTSTAWVMPWK